MSKVAILVIADDITGAAEIAGVAHRAGCRVRFTTSWEQLDATHPAEVTVLATDTRSMSRDEAYRTATEVARALQQTDNGYTHLVKKTDSVLRGHVVAELEPFASWREGKILLLAANPSKGRTIEEGIYRIDGVPLHETIFSTDPEFPARTADCCLLVGGACRRVTPDTEQLERGISIGDGRKVEDYDRYMARFGDGKTLLAGAADMFEALLTHLGFPPRPATRFAGFTTPRTLIVLGSTVRHDLNQEPYFNRHRVVISPMPDAVFNGGEAEGWIEQSLACNQPNEPLLLRIPQAVAVDGNRARHLRRVMSQTVATLVEQLHPEELVIEGGATAFALIERLGWHELEVENQIAPGVVRLRHGKSNTCLTFKPGSYPWGDCFR